MFNHLKGGGILPIRWAEHKARGKRSYHRRCSDPSQAQRATLLDHNVEQDFRARRQQQRHRANERARMMMVKVSKVLGIHGDTNGALFRRFDGDGSGTVTKREFQDALRPRINGVLREPELEWFTHHVSQLQNKKKTPDRKNSAVREKGGFSGDCGGDSSSSSSSSAIDCGAETTTHGRLSFRQFLIDLRAAVASAPAAGSRSHVNVNVDGGGNVDVDGRTHRNGNGGGSGRTMTTAKAEEAGGTERVDPWGRPLELPSAARTFNQRQFEQKGWWGGRHGSKGLNDATRPSLVASSENKTSSPSSSSASPSARLNAALSDVPPSISSLKGTETETKSMLGAPNPPSAVVAASSSSSSTSASLSPSPTDDTDNATATKNSQQASPQQRRRRLSNRTGVPHNIITNVRHDGKLAIKRKRPHQRQVTPFLRDNHHSHNIINHHPQQQQNQASSSFLSSAATEAAATACSSSSSDSFPSSSSSSSSASTTPQVKKSVARRTTGKWFALSPAAGGGARSPYNRGRNKGQRQHQRQQQHKRREAPPAAGGRKTQPPLSSVFFDRQYRARAKYDVLARTDGLIA